MFPRVTHPSATLYCYSVRLACVRPAASVRSEPGSNSQVVDENLSPGWSLYTRQSSRLTAKDRLLTSPKHICPPIHQRQSPQKTARHDELDNVTARVISLGAAISREGNPPDKRARPARTPPSTFLFLPIQLSNSRSSPQGPIMKTARRRHP